MKALLEIFAFYFVINCNIIAFGWSVNPLSWFKNSKGCAISLNSDLHSKHAPVFLTKTTNGFELTMPQIDADKGVFKLSKGDTIVASCPGNSNNLLSFVSNLSLEAKCVKKTTLEIQGREVLSSSLECKSKVGTTLKETHKPCGAGAGEELQLGFEVEGWHRLVTLCFNRNHSTTLYSIHTLHGAVLKGAETKQHQTYFNQGSRRLYVGINPGDAYKQANQIRQLTNILGGTSANHMLARSYLSRGHLSPDADFPVGTWQDLTYFYANTAPQWQTINVGNWLKVENMVRSFAISVNQDLMVTTGTYGVLELRDSNQISQKIYLEPFKKLMPVPLVLWKIIADPNKNTCIVFVVHNNPFLNKAPSKICQDVCKEHGWPTDLNNVSKGFTYCCSYDDFRSKVGYAPELNCKSELKNVITPKKNR